MVAAVDIKGDALKNQVLAMDGISLTPDDAAALFRWLASAGFNVDMKRDLSTGYWAVKADKTEVLK